MTPDIESIALNLSLAQRAAVIREGGYTSTARTLFEAGLYGSISYDRKARYAFLSRPTPLGVAVAAYLRGEG